MFFNNAKKNKIVGSKEQCSDGATLLRVLAPKKTSHEMAFYVGT